MLYIAATPIGNLADSTQRLYQTLQGASLVLAEDTRVSVRLLQEAGSTARLVSYREALSPAAKQRVHEQVTASLADGGSVVFVSDAGTPGIADPAGSLVAAVVEAGFTVSPLPGASALSAILSVSGLRIERPLFVGFLPKKKGRQTLMKQLESGIGGIFDAVVLFESPHRTIALLEAVSAWNRGEIQVVVARELTKMHEEILRGSAAAVVAQLRKRQAVKGEVTILLAMVA